MILALGLRAMRSLPVLQYPRTQNAVVTVTTTFYGADPDVIAGFISTPLETAIAQANGGETPAGGSWRAMTKARSRECGSARSFIQPCSSHSRMAPASSNTDRAQPSIVRRAGRRSLVISIELVSTTAQDESLRPSAVPAPN
jgi:hypothetical protein